MYVIHLHPLDANMQDTTRPAADSFAVAPESSKEHKKANWTELASKNQSELLHSAAYAAFQAPTTALAQISDTMFGTDILPKVQFMEAPQEKKMSDDGYWGQAVGTAVGSLVPFLIVGAAVKGARRGAVTERQLMSQKATLGLATKEAVATGAIHDALLRPSDSGTAGSLLLSRTVNGALGAANMFMFSKVSGAMSSSAQDLLPQALAKHADIGVATLSGLPAGAASAQLMELATHGKLATTDQMVQASLTNMVIGGAFAGAHKFGLHAVEGQKKFKAMDGEQAVKAAMSSVEGTNEALIGVRRDFGKVGLLGLLGVKSFGPEQTLLVRNNTSLGASNPASADRANIIATCNLEAALSGKSVLGTVKTTEQPVFMKPTADHLVFTGSEPQAAGWQHLGLTPAALKARLSGVNKDIHATREAITLLEKAKSGTAMSAGEHQLLEEGLGIPKRTITYDLSRFGQDELNRLQGIERQHTVVNTKKINELEQKRLAGETSDAMIAEEMAAWTQVDDAITFRLGKVTEQRAPHNSEFRFAQTMNQKARARIFELEEKQIKVGLSNVEDDLLSNLRTAQSLQFNGTATRLAQEIQTIKSKRALNFDEAMRERIGLRLLGEGITYYQSLEKVRGTAGLSETERGALQRLQTTRGAIKTAHDNITEAIRANNTTGDAETILSAVHRLKEAQIVTYDRQDAIVFNAHLKGANMVTDAMASAERLAAAKITREDAAKLLAERRDKMTAQEEPLSVHRKNADDIRILQRRIEQLDKSGTELTPSQKAERAELHAVVGQSIESMFRNYLLWAPEQMATKSAHPAPKELRSASMQDGNNDEQSIAIGLASVLNNHKLNLGAKGNQDYINPKNWQGIHVPDGAAADHAKGDYILFNKQTGHYFILDITSSVDSSSRSILFHDIVARGTEVTLADKKGTAALDRRRFILATSPDVDWTHPANFDKGVGAISRLTAETILQDKPFSILDNNMLPSTNPLIAPVLKVAQLRAFQNLLRDQGFREWADEIGRSIGYLQRQS